MHITISDEVVAMLQEVAILVGSPSVNAVGIAILKKECTRILNMAKKEEPSRHEPHANLQNVSQNHRPQTTQRNIQVPEYSEQGEIESANALSAALRKHAGSFQTFENNLGPDVSRASSMQHSPPIPPGNEEHVNFQYPGSSKPIRRVKM